MCGGKQQHRAQQSTAMCCWVTSSALAAVCREVHKSICTRATSLALTGWPAGRSVDAHRLAWPPRTQGAAAASSRGWLHCWGPLARKSAAAWHKVRICSRQHGGRHNACAGGNSGGAGGMLDCFPGRQPAASFTYPRLQHMHSSKSTATSRQHPAHRHGRHASGAGCSPRGRRLRHERLLVLQPDLLLLQRVEAGHTWHAHGQLPRPRLAARCTRHAELRHDGWVDHRHALTGQVGGGAAPRAHPRYALLVCSRQERVWGRPVVQKGARGSGGGSGGSSGGGGTEPGLRRGQRLGGAVSAASTHGWTWLLRPGRPVKRPQLGTVMAVARPAGPAASATGAGRYPITAGSDDATTALKEVSPAAGSAGQGQAAFQRAADCKGQSCRMQGGQRWRRHVHAATELRTAGLGRNA